MDAETEAHASSLPSGLLLLISFAQPFTFCIVRNRDVSGSKSGVLKYSGSEVEVYSLPLWASITICMV